MKRFALGLTMVLAVPAFADSDLPAARWANQQLPDARQEAQAKALMEELRCLVCQGQSIADSDAELAGDMRALVRQRIAAGGYRCGTGRDIFIGCCGAFRLCITLAGSQAAHHDER